MVYVFYCNNRDLSGSGFWQKIMDIIQPLTKGTTQHSSVIPHIYNTDKGDWVKYRNIRWNKAGLEKWAGKELPQLKFERVMVSFPSIKKCYEEKITPDIFLKISRKSTEKEKRYEYVFMLVVKNEILDGFGGNSLSGMLNELKSFLQAVFIVTKERPWAIKESEFQYGDALHDFFPSAILTNADEFVLRDGYQDWEVMTDQ
jgi:hypothetical protein